MQPFRVICETCHARLKVSSASAIGEIHACPKCGSMVEIVPPADGVAPPPSTIGGTSIEIGAVAMPTFDELVMPAHGVADPTVAAVDSIPVVGGRVSYLLMGIGGAAVVVAGGVAALVLLAGSKSTPTAPAAPVAKAPASESLEPPPVEPAISPAETRDTDDQPAAVEPSVATTAAAPEENTVAAAETTTQPAAPAESPPPSPSGADAAPAAPTAANEPPAATSTDPSQAPATAEDKPRPTPVMNFDPLDFDPSQFSFGEGDAARATTDPGSIPKNADVAPAAEDVAESVAASSPSPPPNVDRSLMVRLGPAPDAIAAPHRTAEQLTMRLESFTASDMPLSRFVETVSDLADVAVTLDPIALELAGVSPLQKVSVESQNATVESILRDAFAKQRLELVEREGHVGVVLEGGERSREVVYDVADLAGGKDATSIADLVQRFVAPDSWTAASGGGSIKFENTKLRIEQSQRVRHEVLIFCERLRLGRSLPQRSRYPSAMLAITPAYDEVTPVLRQRATFTFLPWTRLSDVLRHLQDASKLTILVDWTALATMELRPSSPVTCSANDRAWEEALDGILEPIGLAWWVVDGGTIQITSREAVDGIRRIEFYAVPKVLRDQFTSGNAMIETLQQELAGLAAEGSGQSQPLLMELDEPSGRLIVAGNPASHRLLAQRLRNEPKQVASRKAD